MRLHARFIICPGDRIIVFANQKGGVGKSTLCILFADYLAEKRQAVAVIDADLQQTIVVQRQRELKADWAEISDYDLDTAEAMFQTMRWLYVGFMCH